ncbi:MAG: Fic family protein [bacterium]|nr:Fic family protein [bacterium]
MSYFIAPTKEEILEFVRQSNAIEGIRVPENHELFLDHVGAINAAIESLSRGFISLPRDIHGVLMRSQSDKCPGNYRSVGVRIGNIGTPTPGSVPGLMRDLIDVLATGISRGVHDESWIWNIHNEFEAIHPFMDGNGRVGRIWMNIIRLRIGFRWLTIQVKEKQEYYRRINEFRRRSLPYKQYLPDIGNQLDVETICEEPKAADID